MLQYVRFMLKLKKSYKENKFTTTNERMSVCQNKNGDKKAVHSIHLVYDSYLVYAKCSSICSFLLLNVKCSGNVQKHIGHSRRSLSTSANEDRPDVVLFSRSG